GYTGRPSAGPSHASSLAVPFGSLKPASSVGLRCGRPLDPSMAWQHIGAMTSRSVAIVLRSLLDQGVGVRELAKAADLSGPFVSRLARGERGAEGIAPEIATKLAVGLDRLAKQHQTRAAACRKAAKALRPGRKGA